MELAIAALLSEPTQAAAAARTGVSERCLRDWLRRPAFQRAFQEARRHILESATTRLIRLTRRAAAALARAMRCGDSRTELRAADVVLGRSMQAIELSELVARIEVLEQAVQARGQGGAS